jgi:dCTP deaminase
MIDYPSGTRMLTFKPGIQPDSSIRAFIRGGCDRSPAAGRGADPAREPRPAPGRAGLSRPRLVPARPGAHGAQPDRGSLAARDRPDAGRGAGDRLRLYRRTDGRPALPKGLRAAANPKSSTGRLDVFTCVITDRAREFDLVEDGYEGPLFIEISPRTFPVLVRSGSRLSQIRFRAGETRLDDRALGEIHVRETLVSVGRPSFQGGVAVSVDLSGFDGLLGYRGKHHTALIDVDRVGAYRAADFWEPIHDDGSAA